LNTNLSTTRPASEAPTLAAGDLRLAFPGNLVASTVEDCRREALEALQNLPSPCTGATLDLSGAEVADSLGITLILGLYKTCKDMQLHFQVVGANPDLLRVFRLFSLSRLFPIEGR